MSICPCVRNLGAHWNRRTIPVGVTMGEAEERENTEETVGGGMGKDKRKKKKK
jgi:hypothetical protein